MRINTLIEYLSNAECCIISHWRKDIFLDELLTRVTLDKKKKEKEKVFRIMKRCLKIIEYINLITFRHRILDNVNEMIMHA